MRPDSEHRIRLNVEGYGARGSLFETFSNSPKLLELFLKLFDRSRFLSEVVLRRPELIEEVMEELKELDLVNFLAAAPA